MSNNITLIDADSLCYICSRDILQESIQAVDERIAHITKETDADYIALFISKGKYFRHTISNNTYKSNRTYSNTPKYMKLIKEYLITQYNANWMNGVESDDLCAYWMKNPLYMDVLGNFNCDSILSDGILLNPILSAIDKDLLMSIPGKHFNYTFRAPNKDNPDIIDKGWWVTTLQFESQDFRLMQLCVGDSGDCVSGLKGKGIAYWNKIKDTILTLDEMMSEYMDLYGASQGIYEFQKNYRLLHLLDTPQDYLREVNQLPEVPNIIKINKDTTNTNNTTNEFIGLFN